MQILKKAQEFYYENEEMTLEGHLRRMRCRIFAYLGYVFGGAKYYGKGFGAGVKTTESLVAAMEPEAYARIAGTLRYAAKILK